jgi:hypothetical protein
MSLLGPFALTSQSEDHEITHLLIPVACKHLGGRPRSIVLSFDKREIQKVS